MYRYDNMGKIHHLMYKCYFQLLTFDVPYHFPSIIKIIKSKTQKTTHIHILTQELPKFDLQKHTTTPRFSKKAEQSKAHSAGFREHWSLEPSRWDSPPCRSRPRNNIYAAMPWMGLGPAQPALMILLDVYDSAFFQWVYHFEWVYLGYIIPNYWDVTGMYKGFTLGVPLYTLYIYLYMYSSCYLYIYTGLLLSAIAKFCLGGYTTVKCGLFPAETQMIRSGKWPGASNVGMYLGSPSAHENWYRNGMMLQYQLTANQQWKLVGVLQSKYCKSIFHQSHH